MDLALLSQQFVIWATSFADTWGYLGVFVVNFIGSASIFLPVPAFIVTVAFGAIFNPWLVGLISALGATLGEVTGYALGRGGGKAFDKKRQKLLEKSRIWAEKHGLFPVIVLFAITPLPDDIVGIIAGAIKYDIKYFLLATFIGKLVLYTSFALIGYYGINNIMSLFTI